MVALETGREGNQRQRRWTTKRVHQAGLVALLGGVLGIALSPLMTAAYHLTPDGATESTAAWEPMLRSALEPLLTFAGPIAVYEMYGALAFFVFGSLLVGLLGLQAHRRSMTSGKHPSRLEVWGFRAAITGLVLNLLGNVGDYWIGSPDTLDFIAFLGGTVIGLLMLSIGFGLLGVVALRTGLLSQVVGWSMVLFLPAVILVSVLGLNNIPGGPLLPLGIISLFLGYDLHSAFTHRSSNSSKHLSQ